MKTYSITTFGCQMNLSDSERVEAVCKSIGYTQSQEKNIADLYIINTCSVRQKAEDRVIGMGKKFFEFKKENPDVKVILTGCMAKRDIRQGKEKSTDYQEKYAGKLKKQMPWIDYVLEINDIHKIPELLGEKVEGTVEEYFAIKPKYDSKFQAFVPISTGCNKFCTFCIVPFTRGKEVYRPFEQIYNEVKDLVDNGFKEITLLGQNVNSWRNDNTLRTPITPLLHSMSSRTREQSERDPGSPKENNIPVLQSDSISFIDQDGKTKEQDFAYLMEKLADIQSNFWLRFTSSHPYDINMRLIDVIAEKQNIAKQVHFALQSGSNSVLKRMNRYYTSEEFREKVLKIKEKIPGIAITTDVIVGFSGETEEEFEATLRLCEELKFDQIFISEYSRREGTIAAKFYKDDIPSEVKAQRKIRLDEVLKKGVEENNKAMVGTVQKVLAYKTRIKNKEGVFARTSNGKDVLIKVKNEELETNNCCRGTCNNHANLHTCQLIHSHTDILANSNSNQVKLGEFVEARITGFKGFCLEGEIAFDNTVRIA